VQAARRLHVADAVPPPRVSAPEVRVTVAIEAFELVDDIAASQRSAAPAPRLSLTDYLDSRTGA
jgi:hypothetical protein